MCNWDEKRAKRSSKDPNDRRMCTNIFESGFKRRNCHNFYIHDDNKWIVEILTILYNLVDCDGEAVEIMISKDDIVNFIIKCMSFNNPRIRNDSLELVTIWLKKAKTLDSFDHLTIYTELFESIISILSNKQEESRVKISAIEVIHTALKKTEKKDIDDNELAFKFQNLGGLDVIENIESTNEDLINNINSFIRQFYDNSENSELKRDIQNYSENVLRSYANMML